jgi:hypothetical protein
MKRKIGCLLWVDKKNEKVEINPAANRIKPPNTVSPCVYLRAWNSQFLRKPFANVFHCGMIPSQSRGHFDFKIPAGTAVAK